MLDANPGEGPMKRTLVAAIGGLLCAGAAGEGLAAPGTIGASAPASATGPADAAGPGAAARPLAFPAYVPKLQEFYTQGKVILDRSGSDRLSDPEVESRFKDFMAWANEAGAWMNANIGPAATAQFTTWRMKVGDARKLSGTHSDEQNNKFRALTTVLPQLLDNLKAMMKPGGVAPTNPGAVAPTNPGAVAPR
jgi:hypothetical protein